MPVTLLVTPTERERLGVLVNNINFYASQLLNQNAPQMALRALTNLAKAKSEDETLLRRVDELARERGDESPLRLIEDLARAPGDVAQMLALARRCMLAAAFLGHCIAQPNYAQMPLEHVAEGKRLH